MNQSNTRYFWLSAEQMRRLQPFFAKVRGRARANDCKVLSGIVFVQRTVFAGKMRQRSTAPTRPCITGSPEVPDGHLRQDISVTGTAKRPRRYIDDGQHIPEGAPHRGQTSKVRGSGNDPVDRFPEGRDRPRAIRRTKGGLNSKLHMLSDGQGRPLNFFLSPGQMADSRGALELLRRLVARWPQG
jgi:transposase